MVQYMDKNSGFAQWNANKNANVKKSPFSGFVWWFCIFVAIWWLLGSWMAPKQTDVQADTAPAVDLSGVPVHNISNDVLDLSVQGLRISNIKLKDFSVSSTDTTPVTLLPDGSYAEFGLIVNGATGPTATTVWRDQDGTYSWRNADGILFTRTIAIENYVIKIVDTITNKSKQDIAVAPYARIVRDSGVAQSAGVSTGAIVYENSDLERVDWNRLGRRSYAYKTTSGFIGFADQYWETIASLASLDQTMTLNKQGADFSADVVAGAISVASGATVTVPYDFYAGPLEPDALATANKYIAGIDDTIDYGWFGFLARPMLWFINLLNSLVMNYGVAIILMTLILRMLMWPLTRKSYTSMIAMQKMQPELQRVQKLYANDKMRLQAEMLKVYQTHKTSPMSGCLPMLIQIPLFFALYKALLISVQMRSANFLWITDLGAMDPYFILPILMGATMWLQQI